MNWLQRLFYRKPKCVHKWKIKERLTVFGFPSETKAYRERGGRGGDFLPVNLKIYACKCGAEKRVYQDIWDKKYKEVEINEN